MTNMRYALTIIIMSSLSSSWSWFFSSQPVRGLQLFGWGWSHPLYWACQVWLLALSSFRSHLYHHHKPSTQQHRRHPRLEQGDHRKCGDTSICDAPPPRRGLCLHQVRTRGLQHTFAKFYINHMYHCLTRLWREILRVWLNVEQG